jgi:hypothetical protein
LPESHSVCFDSQTTSAFWGFHPRLCPHWIKNK